MVIGRLQIPTSNKLANDDRLTTVLYLLRASGERQQSDISRLLDRSREAALVWRADASQASRCDLAAFRHELRQQTHILVIDRFDFLDAELANLLAPEKLASAFTRAARASAGTWTAW